MNQKSLCRLFLVLLILFGLSVGNDARALISPPKSQKLFPYPPAVSPVLKETPAKAKPMGMGTVAAGEDMWRLHVALAEWSGPVDLYLMFYIPTLDSKNVYLLTSKGAFQNAAKGLVPWKENLTASINQKPFGGIPEWALPPGTYYVFLLAAPAGRLDRYFAWLTHFFVGGWTFEQVETLLVKKFGQAGAFDAVMLALDRGYSLAQITEAAVTNRLTIAGTVKSVFGGQEPPTGKASDLILKAAAIPVSADGPKYDIYELRKQAEESAELTKKMLVRIIVELANTGYSVAQITEGIMLGTIDIREIYKPKTGPIEYVLVIEDSSGNALEPELARKNVFAIPITAVNLTGPTDVEIPDGKESVQKTYAFEIIGGKGPYTIVTYTKKGKILKAGPKLKTWTRKATWTINFALDDIPTLELNGLASDSKHPDWLAPSKHLLISIHEPLPYKHCTIWAKFDKGTTRHTDQWGKVEDVVGLISVRIRATGEFRGTTFTGVADSSPDRTCSGTMEIMTEPVKNAAGIYTYRVKPFRAENRCTCPDESSFSILERIRGGSGITLERGEDVHGKFLSGHVWVGNDETCGIIPLDNGLYFKRSFWGDTSEYLNHSCDKEGYIEIFCRDSLD